MYYVCMLGHVISTCLSCELLHFSIQMVLKVHNVDGSTKMIAIHEQMNTRDVCILLAERNHKPIGPNWTLVEKLNDLHLGE